MIYVNQDSINEIICTLTNWDGSQLYLELTSNNREFQVVLQMGLDLSSEPIRYNKFEIQVGAVTPSITPQVDLPLSSYDYRFFYNDTIIGEITLERGLLELDEDRTIPSSHQINTNNVGVYRPEDY